MWSSIKSQYSKPEKRLYSSRLGANEQSTNLAQGYLTVKLIAQKWDNTIKLWDHNSQDRGAIA